MASAPYTLTEVSRRTGISMSTLLRYKKLHHRRIPSLGRGRMQRYPRKALSVFAALKREKMAKRGAKAAATKRRRARASARKTRSTAKRVVRNKSAAKRSAVRKVTSKKRRTPSKKTATKRTGARQSSTRTPDVSNAALSERLAKIEMSLAQLTMQLQQLITEVKRPIRVTIGE